VSGGDVVILEHSAPAAAAEGDDAGGVAISQTNIDGGDAYGYDGYGAGYDYYPTPAPTNTTTADNTSEAAP